MNTLKVINLGLTDYSETWKMQKEILAQSAQRADTLILVEHNPVITFGRGKNDKSDILVSQEYLKKKGIEVIEVDRGGSVTLHCPGQLVGYPLIDLNKTGKDIHKYINKLEEVIIKILSDYGIKGERREGFTGVWVGQKKIASIGVGVKHWITYHGFALNVNPDMSVISVINPCGLKNKKMTAVAELTKQEISMQKVRELTEKRFREVFGMQEKQEFPPWIKRRVSCGTAGAAGETANVLKDLKLNTVCNSAICPNKNECFSKGTATFMILGDVCTRNCNFCSVSSGLPGEPDKEEPKRIAQAVKKMKLKHIVITSVTRDDLKDGGAGQFVEVIKEIRKINQKISVELLVPDFKGNIEAMKRIISAKPEVIGHNLETVPRLYKEIRSNADYRRSLDLLKSIKKYDKNILTKSGVMLGLGETKGEVIEVLEDLSAIQCDIVTLGQYLRPSKYNVAVQEFVKPEVFENYKKIGLEMGFRLVISGPFVRSSYHAEEAFQSLEVKI
ncbi:MAG: lipoyl synthase [Elusimicrobia bacterium]|nr:lipoyl synthase [Elusimicrobiota bacterium]MBU2615219.1 lipoyl synthase [Elusimicrobiota bacterium]